MKRFNLLATIALLLFAFSAKMAFAATFNDLTNYQKQKYWEYMKTDCAPLVKNYKEFKACEAKAIQKAAKEKEPVAAYCTDNDGIDFMKLGMVKSNLYPAGKLDYSQTFKNGTTYVMEGACGKDKKYYVIQKNCAELGNYKAKDGVCVIANHAPKFEVDALPDSTINEGETLTLQIVATDEDGDAIKYSDENLPEGANFDWTEEKPEHGIFEWTPTYQQSGEYTVTFSVTDGKLKDTIKGKIIVTDKNQTPEMIIVMNSTEVNEGEEHKIYLHASDKDGDLLEFSAENLPEGSTFDNDVPPSFPQEFGSKHAVFTWTPGYQQAGEYEITFKVSDGKGGEDDFAAPVTVKNVNAAPILDPIGDKNLKTGSTITLQISATDLDGDSLEYSIDNIPAGATFEQNLFNWKPTYEQAGSYDVTFKVTDGTVSDIKTVKITVSKNGTEICGIINESTTLKKADSPYIVTCHILLPENVTLQIEPGVNVLFNGPYYIKVQGEFIADGTPDDYIVFSSNKNNPQPGDWDKIKFEDSSVDWDAASGSRIRHSIIEYGGLAQGYYESGEVFANYSSPLFENNKFLNFLGSGVSLKASNSIVKKNNIIQFTGTGIATSVMSSSLIEDNDILFFSGVGISIESNSNPYISNNHISSFKNYENVVGLGSSFSYGIKSTLSSPSIISNEISNCIEGCDQNYGIDAFESKIIIQENTIKNVNTGIYVSKSYGEILNNSIYDNTSSGIDSGQSSQNSMSINGNFINKNKNSGVVFSSCGGIKMSNNDISYNSNYGIYIMEGCGKEENLITNNNISNNGEAGINLIAGGNWLSVAAEFVVKNNILNNNNQFGIGIKGWMDILIKNNNIKNNSNGVYFLINQKLISADIYENNLDNNSGYALYLSKDVANPNVQDINAQSNWWGTADEAVIKSMIYDFYDDFDLPEVIYGPVAESMFTW